jgi:chemotaxis signal transduction protein
MVGCIMHRGATLSVFDLAEIVGQKDGAGRRSSGHIVVMTLAEDTRFGLLVDDLGEIVEVLASRLAPLPSFMTGQSTFADTVITHDETGGGSLIVVLSAERLFGTLTVPAGDTIPPDINGMPAASADIEIACSA